ncbi:MAG: chromate resistance protein ChrB domain-containing protein [Betaproteobacteria bacterium]
MWAILILTLPTQPNAVRLRIWRALKSLGCVALRDGAFLLPLEHASLLEALATEVREHGGSASVLSLSPRDPAQRDEVLAQFDRTDSYARWRESATALQLDIANLGETDARRRLRGVADALLALRRIDYYPGPAAEQADTDLLALRKAVDAQFSRGEPQPRTDADIARLDRAKFHGKRWATRARPWVDRLACAWLIRRFIDPKAVFVWLPDGPGAVHAPRETLGFDFDGARFTHVGTRVTFEVMAASFGLDADPRLQRIAQSVHYLDVGGIPVPEAAGLESVLGGLRELHTDDSHLAAAAAAVFDALYATPGADSRVATGNELGTHLGNKSGTKP